MLKTPGLKRMLRLSDKGYRGLKSAIAACVVANLTLLLPFMVSMRVIETLIDPLTTGGPLDTGRLWVLFGLGVLAALLYFFAYRYEYDKTYTASYRECESTRVEVGERMRRLPLSFFNRKDLSELTANIMGDCANIEHTLSHLVPGMAANIITITLACLMMALYDWRMAFSIFCTMPLSFGIILATRKIQARFGSRHVQAKLGVSDQVQEYLDGIKVVKAFGLSGEKHRELDRALRNMMKEAIAFEMLAGSFVVIAQMLLRAGTGLVILVGVTLLTDGRIGVVPFLTFVLISAKIYAPVTTIMTLLPEFFYMLTATGRVHKLREEPVMDGDDKIALPDSNIVFENVSFSYNPAEPKEGEEQGEGDETLRGINIAMPQNGVTALVGPSGSGKSTIARLIARFWDADRGSVTIGGKNIREIEPECLMRSMSFVFQDVVLFNDTVMNNIRLGKQDATNEEVYRAARLARCDEFIRAMPGGYETVIGENGCTISGGERQRISIARALLKDAPIVLLDEATASLDPENEVLIQEAISELVRGRTVIVIAHRLRTVAGADNIIVLEDGAVVEQGRSEDLLNRGGLFAKLYRTQQDSLGWSVGA